MKGRFHLGSPAVAFSLSMFFSVMLHGGADAEDQLKAATLLAFVQNAHWVEEPPAESPLTVGVIGRAEFIRRLHTNVEGKSVNGHPLRILAMNAPIDPRCCQVIYFATDKAADIKPALLAFSSAHTLTIGETDGFLEQGGAVNLFLMDGHMAFEVSLSALSREGVEISSKLLRFGQIRDLARGRPAR